MEGDYTKLVLFIENLYQHRFISFHIVDHSNTKILQKNVFCNKCNNTFTLDITYEIYESWNLLNNFYYRFFRHDGDHYEKLTCNEIIIKNIIE